MLKEKKNYTRQRGKKAITSKCTELNKKKPNIAKPNTRIASTMQTMWHITISSLLIYSKPVGKPVKYEGMCHQIEDVGR